MKLIDILVRDLHKFGGWPEGAVECVRFVDEATIDFYDENGNWHDDCSLTYGPIAKEICIIPTEPCQRESVKLSEYEAALAASKPEWDGEGVPPVGADVQCICNQFPSEGQEKLLGKILYSGEYTILLTYKTNEQHHVPVESVLMTKHWSITPIRSEADKKREIGVLSLARADPTVGRFEYGEKMSDGRLIGYAWYELYDKIAAGEVAGIRID